MRRRGFTLIELLVVVAIIAVLIAILLPSLNLAKRRANTARCLTSVRGLGQSVQLYIADWGAMFPFSTNKDLFWVTLLNNAPAGTGYGASGKLRVCPEAPAPISTAADTVGTAHSQWTNSTLTGTGLSSSYGINGWVYALPTDAASQSTLTSAVASSHNGSYQKLTKAEKSSEIPIFVDCNWRHLWAFPGDLPPSGSNDLERNGPDSITGAVDQVHPLTRAVMNRHNRAVNVAFADGHGDTVPLQRLWTLNWYRGWQQPTSLPSIPTR